MGEKARRTIRLTLPEELVSELDGFARTDNKSRSEFVALAMKNYLRERRRVELKGKIKEGYRRMGEINLSIAANCLKSDESAFKIYEEFLSESENSDSKTR